MMAITAKRERLFTDEDIAKANSTDILNYAIEKGYEPKQISNHSFKIAHEGGLYIQPAKNTWNCFAKNVGGGPIQFVMQLENKSWVEAVKMLIGYTPEKVDRGFYVKKDFENQPKGEFIVPEKSKTSANVFAYLHKIRGIDYAILQEFAKNGLLYQSKQYNNCVFAGKNENGEIVFSSLRGANKDSNFKGDVPNSDKRYSFNRVGTTDTLNIFESPIDLMSFMSLQRLKDKEMEFKDHYLSLGGVSDKALKQYLSKHPEIKTIVSCLDNDEAGRFATNQIYDKYGATYSIKTILPEGKDFNEELLKNVQIAEIMNRFDTKQTVDFTEATEEAEPSEME